MKQDREHNPQQQPKLSLAQITERLNRQSAAREARDAKQQREVSQGMLAKALRRVAS